LIHPKYFIYIVQNLKMNFILT